MAAVTSCENALFWLLSFNHLTFKAGGGGGGGFGFFVLGNNFFPQPLLIEFFSLTYNSIVCQVFPGKIFSPLKSVYRMIFSLRSPIPHLKSQMVGPLAHRENGLSVPGL